MKKSLLLITLLTSSIMATTVAFKGKEVTLNSNGLSIGADAPKFMGSIGVR